MWSVLASTDMIVGRRKALERVGIVYKANFLAPLLYGQLDTLLNTCQCYRGHKIVTRLGCMFSIDQKRTQSKVGWRK